MPFAARCVLLLFLATLSASLASAQPAEPVRGHLVIIGGGSRPASVMQLFARLAGGTEGKVLVFPQASELADSGERIQKELAALGIGRVVIVNADRTSADADDTLHLTDGATGAYFGGGDQARLMAVLRGSKLEGRLHEMYRRGAVMGGTSAGAAVMSRVMITGDERRPLSSDESWQSLEVNNVVTADGLGFLPDAVVDQHFVVRRRTNRLMSVVAERPDLIGIGIDEATAIWVKPDRSFEVVGDGPVVVFDAKGAEALTANAGYGYAMRGLAVHVLRAGSTYKLSTREVTLAR